MFSPCSSPDSGPSYDILNLADAANVFVANSIRQNVAGLCFFPVTHLEILISVCLSAFVLDETRSKIGYLMSRIYEFLLGRFCGFANK